MSKVMTIGDTHLPFDHPNYLKFLIDTYNREKPDTMVHIGDFMDLYALSRFTLDPDVQGQKPEWEASLKRAKLYYKAFPQMYWIQGNHDQRAYRQAQTVGLGKLFMKEMNKVFQCPPDWEICTSKQIDGVNYFHGVAAGGGTGWQMYSQRQGRSAVIGHIHSVGGVRYHQNVEGKQVFTMAVGCGVDDSAYAFQYGKESASKSMLGCGIVENGTVAKFIPMDLSERKYRRIR